MSPEDQSNTAPLPSSARRRLLRGVVAGAAVLPVGAGATAVASNLRCVANIVNTSTLPDSVAGGRSADKLSSDGISRVPLYKSTKTYWSNGVQVTKTRYWVKGADLVALKGTSPGSLPSGVTASNWELSSSDRSGDVPGATTVHARVLPHHGLVHPDAGLQRRQPLRRDPLRQRGQHARHVRLRHDVLQPDQQLGHPPHLLELLLRGELLRAALMRLQRVPGLRAEPVGAMWAVFSPLSGRTSLLSDLSAAVLEVLEPGPLDEEALFRTLSSDSATDVGTIESLVQPAIRDLRDAGLLQSCPD